MSSPFTPLSVLTKPKWIWPQKLPAFNDLHGEAWMRLLQILEQPGPDLPDQQMFPTSPAAFSLSLSIFLLDFFFLFEALSREPSL